MKTKMKIAISLLLTAAALIAAPSVHAGRGSSRDAITSAIASNSVDAIASELERAERLYCPSCVPLVRPLLDHTDRRVRQVAAWWLARRGLADDLLEQMTPRLRGADPTAARNAADVLGALRRPQAIVALGAALTTPTVAAEARAAAALALGRIGELAALPALTSALAADDPAVRAAALASMRELRGFGDPLPAIPALADQDAKVRGQAIYTIGATGGSGLGDAARVSAARALADRLASDSSATVRRQAAWALGEIGAPASVAAAPLSRAAEGDADVRVRTIARAAITRLSR